MIKATDINRNGHLTHMVAQDLFIDQGKQVFHAKTGRWLGTIIPGQELNFTEEVEPKIVPDETTPDPAQLQLF